MKCIDDTMTTWLISDLHSGQLTQQLTMNDQSTDDDNIFFKGMADVDFVKTKECYLAVKQILLEYSPETSFPVYDEWIRMIDDGELHQPNLDFQNPGTGMGAFAAKVGMDALRSSGLFSGSADELMSKMRQATERGIRARAKSTASKIFESFADKGDGGTSERNYLGGSRFNPSGLSQTLKPIDTRFDTDIPFQGQTRYWQDGKENSGPLFIKGGVPGLVSINNDSNRDQQMWDLIQGPITMEWNRAIANRITWTGRVVALLTETNIVCYFNRCLQALAVYYYWRSVIAFTNDENNRNAGMDLLRDQLTPNDYNNLFNLRREIMQCAIPPFVHEFMFYMMGTYRQNELPTSPIMKLMPHSFATSTDPFFSGAAATYNGKSSVDLARVNLDQIKEFSNVLSRAIGVWGGTEPFEYNSSPRVDPNYTTFWTNANYWCRNSTGTVAFPQMNDDQDELTYNIHTDAPNGWLSAMVAPKVINSQAEGVGLFHPWMLDALGTGIMGVGSTYSAYGVNCLTSCYMYNATGSAGFWPIESAQTYQALSGNTFNTLGTSSTFHKFQRFGTERVILTSINALRQANFQFLDLMYTVDFKALPNESLWKGISDGVVQRAPKSTSYSGRKRRGSKRTSKISKSRVVDDTSDMMDKDEI